MKSHQPTANRTRRRGRRAADEVAAPEAAAQSPAQSLETLRQPQASQAARGVAVRDLGGVLGNTKVERVLAQREGVGFYIQRSPLSDELSRLWNPTTKAAFFHRLRSAEASQDLDTQHFVMRMLHGDDKWLALNLLSCGPEPNWPIHLRVEREMKGWGDSGGKNAVFNILLDAQGSEANNELLTATLRQVLGAETDDFQKARELQTINPRVAARRARWNDIAVINVNGLNIEVYGASSEELTIIQNTLSILPARHIRQVPRIAVGSRVGPIGTGSIMEGGNSARSEDAQLSRVEVTHYALQHKLRGVGESQLQVCITLLHEIGHWVDWNLIILPPRNSRARQDLEEWFQTLHYGGRTQGAGERSAEAYWRFFVGGLPPEIRSILDASAAFQALDDDALHLELRR